MARLKDAVLDKEKLYAGTAPAANLVYGGQQGYMPRIGTIAEDGKVYEEWISSEAYVSKNIIPVVIRTPKFFELMDDKAMWIDTFKALIELHPQTITGLTSGLTVEFDETAVGGAGEQLESLTDVKRARSSVSMTYKEKANKAITKFFDTFIRYGMMDPDVKAPLVTKLINNIDEIGGIYSADFWTATVIFIEPDVTQRVCVDAWLRTNMAPKSNGERTGERNMANAGSGKELSIDWTGITMNNAAVLKLGQKFLDEMSVLSKLPDTDMVVPTAPDGGISADVDSSNIGYNEHK